MHLSQMSRPSGLAPMEERMPTVSWVRTCFDIANSQVSFRIFGSEKSPSTPPILFFSSCNVSFLYFSINILYSFMPPLDATTEYTAPRMSGFIFPVLNIALALFIIPVCPERPKREIQRERSNVSVCISFFLVAQGREQFKAKECNCLPRLQQLCRRHCGQDFYMQIKILMHQ